MNDKVREVFLCPNCSGPSTAAGDGNALCEDCGHEFPLPGKAAKKATETVAQTALPVMPPAPKESPGAVRRNIVLKTKENFNAPKPGQPEVSAEESPPIVTRSNFEERQEEQGKRRRKMKKRKKVPARVYAKWLVIWLLTVGTILFAVTQFQLLFSEDQEKALSVEERLVGEEYEFYKREYPQILSQFSGFVRARTAGEMAEFTRDSNQLTRKMSRYFKDRAPRIPTSGLRPSPTFWNVAFEESPGFVEVVWDGKDKGSFEGVFVKQGDKWLLDWEQYVRYSSDSWTLFQEGIGAQYKGNFRLYVQKVAEGEGEDFEPWMKVKFYPPDSDAQRRKLGASEEIVIKGPLYTAFSSVFADLSGRSEGFSELWKRDERGLRRVAVELEWQTDLVSGEERMVIKNLLAKNWRTFEVEEEQPASQTKNENLMKDE